MTPKKLKAIRKLLGWPLSRLGAATGYSKQHISSLENGHDRITEEFWLKMFEVVVDHRKKLMKIKKSA